MSKNDSIVEILRADEIIVDILIENKNIIIKTFENTSAAIYSDSIMSEVYDYKILIDSTLSTVNMMCQEMLLKNTNVMWGKWFKLSQIADLKSVPFLFIG